MDGIPVQLYPTSVPDWEAEDLVSGVLADPVALATDTEAREMLDKVRLTLPQDIIESKLGSYDEKSPFGTSVTADTSNYSFYIVQVPLNILMPEGRLSRLRLMLNLKSDAAGDSPVVAYDLFPPDKWDLKHVSLGEAKVDVSKALMFVCPAAPDCLGLNLTWPIGWDTQVVSIQTSDRMSNPMEWYVTDNSIQHGFTGSVIVRAPKSARVTIEARLVCEVRQSGLLQRVLKGRFESRVQIYHLKSSQS